MNNEIKFAARLDTILASHQKWLRREAGGSRADLSRANLSGADLSGADLSRADLSGADLSRANLSRANLSRADLSRANLFGANLSGANLSGANLSRADLSRTNLSGADLSRADLSGANLFGANLSRADLSRANLSGADLSGADLSGADLSATEKARLSVVPESGSFHGWKKCRNGVLVRVEIPAEACRSNATGRKCRAEFVRVLEVVGASVGVSKFDQTVSYRVGETVRCDYWCEDRWNECAGGIHFFITRAEAEAY